MIYITVSLFALSLAGVETLLICKGFGRQIKNSYLLARALFAIFGLAIFLLGVCFHLRSWPYAVFFSTLFGMLGSQIGLWSMGISGEIIGNRPLTEGASEFGSLLNGILESRLSLASGIILGVLAISIVENIHRSRYGNGLPPRSIDFIQQVRAETSLPERPAWLTETVKSTDRYGKEIEVVVGVLWDPYRWVKGSTEQVSIDEDTEKARFSVGDVIKNFQNTEKRPIIVIGTASHENAVENPEQEIGRAKARGDTLVTLCGEHFINRPHIYSLNLGAFRMDRRHSVFSASERRVILLVIMKGEDSLDLTSGVKNALIKAKAEQSFIFDARDYSLFETTRFQVVPRLNF